MIYSVYPIRLEDYNGQHTSREYRTGKVKGVPVEYYQNEHGDRVVNRVMCTSLNVYLDRMLTPGTVINEFVDY